MTQIEILANELKTIKVNITTEDKKNCVNTLKIHHNTNSMYLKGEGKNADLAAKMLNFYKRAIAKRNEVLE